MLKRVHMLIRILFDNISIFFWVEQLVDINGSNKHDETTTLIEIYNTNKCP